MRSAGCVEHHPCALRNPKCGKHSTRCSAAWNTRAPARHRARSAHAGLALLAAFGWGLDLGRCVSCGKPCPEGQGALVDVARGGLVCRACGGARAKLSGELRGRMQRAAAGESDVLVPSDVDAALDLVDRAFRTHLGIE
ncbi:MAG: DNA repair protein RecO C-terminal domain-containing protein [Polyangiaceae bacterium]